LPASFTAVVSAAGAGAGAGVAAGAGAGAGAGASCFPQAARNNVQSAMAMEWRMNVLLMISERIFLAVVRCSFDASQMHL
jgi:hypothetical protein